MSDKTNDEMTPEQREAFRRAFNAGTRLYASPGGCLMFIVVMAFLALAVLR